MGDFKRNSSRFSRGGSSGGSSSRSGGGYSRGGSRSSGERSEGSSERSEGRSGGGYNRRSSGGNGGGSNKEFAFTRVADLTMPKTAPDDMTDYVHGELKGSDIRMNAKIYLGKGEQELVLKNGDMLLVDFKVSDKAPEYVVGKVSVKN